MVQPGSRAARVMLCARFLSITLIASLVALVFEVRAAEPPTSQPGSDAPPASRPVVGGPALDLTPPPEGAPQPRFVLNEQGATGKPVWRGEPLRFNLEVRNAGEAPLAVRMQGCCGSQVVPPAERRIEPGKTELFGLDVNTAGTLAEIKKKVTFETNDRQNARVTVDCVARVKTGIAPEPRGVTFGELPRSAEQQKQTVVLRRGDGGPIRPSVAEEPGHGVRTEIREVEPGQRYELDVLIGPPWPNGVLRTNIVLNTGVPEAPTESVSVYAFVTPRVELVPSRFALQQGGREPQEIAAQVRWDGTPGRVLEVTSNDPGVTPRIEERDGAQTIVVSVPAGYKPAGRITRHIVLKLDDAQVPELKVPLFITNRPQVRVAPGGNEREGEAEPQTKPADARHPGPPGMQNPRKARLVPGGPRATSGPAR